MVVLEVGPFLVKLQCYSQRFDSISLLKLTKAPKMNCPFLSKLNEPLVRVYAVTFFFLASKVPSESERMQKKKKTLSFGEFALQVQKEGEKEYIMKKILPFRLIAFRNGQEETC